MCIRDRSPVPEPSSQPPNQPSVSRIRERAAVRPESVGGQGCEGFERVPDGSGSGARAPEQEHGGGRVVQREQPPLAHVYEAGRFQHQCVHL